MAGWHGFEAHQWFSCGACGSKNIREISSGIGPPKTIYCYGCRASGSIFVALVSLSPSSTRGPNKMRSLTISARNDPGRLTNERKKWKWKLRKQKNKYPSAYFVGRNGYNTSGVWNWSIFKVCHVDVNYPTGQLWSELYRHRMQGEGDAVSL